MDRVACAIKLDREVKKNLTQKTPSQMDVAPWCYVGLDGMDHQVV